MNNTTKIGNWKMELKRLFSTNICKISDLSISMAGKIVQLPLFLKLIFTHLRKNNNLVSFKETFSTSFYSTKPP